jgi:hypothetical protein
MIELRLSSLGATVSLLLYGLVVAIVYRIVGGEPPSSWSELFSIILTIVFTVLLLWIPATTLMIISVIFGYPYNTYVGVSSVIVGLLHIVFAAWTYFAFSDKTFTWFMLALVSVVVGFVLTYLGVRLLVAYKRKKLVELEVLYDFEVR